MFYCDIDVGEVTLDLQMRCFKLFSSSTLLWERLTPFVVNFGCNFADFFTHKKLYNTLKDDSKEKNKAL